MIYLICIIIAFFPAFGPATGYAYVDVDQPLAESGVGWTRPLEPSTMGEQGSYDALR